MKLGIKTYLLISLILAAVIGTLLGRVEESTSAIQSFPATVCPGNLTDGTTTDILPNAKVLGASIPNSKNKLKTLGSTNLLTKKPLLVDGGKVTSISISRGSNGSLATVNCSISDGNDWFVGGSSSVSSKGTLSLVNSGLSAAQVDLVIYSSKAASILSKTVPANSSADIPLDTLAPGEDAIAVNVITRSGRVSPFMIDNRKQGLRSVGSDYVATSSAPSKLVVIPNIPRIAAKKGGKQIIRVVVPGNQSATLRATIYSSDGSFAPIGLDGANVSSASVRDINFNPIVADSSFSLRLESDVPISAAVLSNNSGDFLWSTPSDPINNTVLQIGGFAPLIRAYGEKINLTLNLIDISGNRSSVTLIGSDTLAFRPKKPLLRIEFNAKEKNNFASLIINNGSGIAQLPVVSGARLERSELPRSDARTINRG